MDQNGGLCAQLLHLCCCGREEHRRDPWPGPNLALLKFTQATVAECHRLGNAGTLKMYFLPSEMEKPKAESVLRFLVCRGCLPAVFFPSSEGRAISPWPL